MTTKTTNTPAESTTPARVIYQGLVKIHTIEVREQVRKKFDRNAADELAQSIKTKGVISPITVRPGKTGERPYILVAGERRLRAALSAGLEEVPVIVRDLDDQAAALYQVEENIHRKDLSPIEEARGFKLLLDAKKFTVEQLAALVDKSTAYVYRSLALLELPKDAVAAIESGTITPAHGHQILRVPQFEREELVQDLLKGGYDGHIMSAIELRDHVQSELGSSLDSATFPKDKPFAGMSACATCPSNTGNQGKLFDGAEKGMCLNSDCFKTKTKQAGHDFLKAITQKYPKAKDVRSVSGYVYSGQQQGEYQISGPFEKEPKGEYAIIVSGKNLWTATPAKNQKQSSGAPQGKPADPKQTFIDNAVSNAMMKAGGALGGKIKMTVEDWRRLAESAVSNLADVMVAEVLGGDGLDLKKANEAQLRALVLLDLRLPYEPRDADFKKLGVDVAKIKKEAEDAAERDWIVQRASEGIKWPKNIADVDRNLISALHHTSDAEKRWAKLRKSAATNAQIEEQLRYEWSESQGSAGGGLNWNAARGGLQFWLGSKAGKEPTLKGSATVARARIVLGIPYPQGA